MTKYTQKFEVEKTPDFVLSHLTHFAGKIFFQSCNGKGLSQKGPIFGVRKFSGGLWGPCELR
jgi:hypothetical protein